MARKHRLVFPGAMINRGDLKTSIDVTNAWLAEKLGMGSGAYVSKHVGLARRASGSAHGAWLRRLTRMVNGET